MFSFFSKNKVNSIDVSKIDELLPSIKLIDIREPYETKTGSIRGSIKIPMTTLLRNPEKYLDKENDYYIICHSSMRSLRTSKHLSKLGYKVINVRGGFKAYNGKNIKR